MGAVGEESVVGRASPESLAIGNPANVATDAFAARFTERGDGHAGVMRTPVGWVLPAVHDRDGHEVRFDTVPLEIPADEALGAIAAT